MTAAVFAKRYADPAAAARAAANHRWLTELGGPLRLPRLIAVTGPVVLLERVPGRHAHPADLVALARHLGDGHGWAHTRRLHAARLDTPHPAGAGGRRATSGAVAVRPPPPSRGPAMAHEMDGRVCLVTGGKAGIGYETALGLAQLGATVVLVARDRDKGEDAQRRIEQTTGNPSLDLLIADLAAMDSRCAPSRGRSLP